VTWFVGNICPSLRTRSPMLAAKVPPGQIFPFWMVSGADWRVWSLPPRPTKRFKVAVGPDASLTFKGCAAAEPDD